MLRLKNIVLTNDDGPLSLGLRRLADALAEICKLTVIVPDGQRSATGKALTFNRPLRINEKAKNSGYRMITHDGTPADSVILARSLVDEIDLFVSGINQGANIGYQSMYTSGTVGAVMEAAMQGFPGIAVSRVVNPIEWFNHSDEERDYSGEVDITVDLAQRILSHEMPNGVDALNLNFPCTLSEKSRIMVTRPTRIRMINTIETRQDPVGNPYYWIKGTEKESPAGTDAAEVLQNGNISLSPIIIEAAGDSELQAVRDFMDV